MIIMHIMIIRQYRCNSIIPMRPNQVRRVARADLGCGSILVVVLGVAAMMVSMFFQIDESCLGTVMLCACDRDLDFNPVSGRLRHQSEKG